MLESKAKIRLFVEAPLKRGEVARLDEKQVHYLAHVMRITPGGWVRLFNGRDGEWLSRVDRLGRSEGSVFVEQVLRVQTAEAGPALLFAPIKKDSLDFLVTKATELGVAHLWPVETAHTITSRVNTKRLQASVTEAAEQCGRLSVPIVHDPSPFAALLAAWPEEGHLFLCHPMETAPPLAEVLRARPLAATAGFPAGYGLLIGPEGGLAASELDAATRLPFVTCVSLGPRILRAETAALAALVCWQVTVGDWRSLGEPIRSAPIDAR